MDAGAGLQCDAPEPGSTAVKLWYIPKSTAQCGDLQPYQAGGHIEKRTRPIGQVGTPKGQGFATLTQEPAPLGRRGAHPKGHCPSTLTNEPAPLGRGSSGNRISVP